MPQSDPLQFKSAKLFKGYKPIICVKLISKPGNDTYRFSSKAVTPAGDAAYTHIIKSLPSISRTLELMGGMSSIGSISFSILNQEKYSDFLRTSTDKIGLTMGTALVALLFDDGTAVTWAERLELFTGIIDDFSFDYKTLKFSIIDNDKSKNKLIGIKIVDTDADQIPSDSIGKIKPIIYGDQNFHYGEEDTSLDVTELHKNNMTEAKYLGVDSDNKHRYLIADHTLHTSNAAFYRAWMYDTQLGRFVKIDTTQVTYSIDGNGNTIIQIDSLPNLYDYWYPIKSDNLQLWTNYDNASDFDMSTYADSDISDIHELTFSRTLHVDFATYDAHFAAGDVLEHLLFFKSHYTESTPGDGKYIVAAGGDSFDLTGYDNTQLNNETRTVLGYPETRLYFKHEQMQDFAGISHAYIYEVFQRIKYKATEMFPVFIACKGYEYDTWINGRSTGETDPNTGLNYTVNHPDDDGAGDLIENPVGVIESVARDLLSLGNSDIEVNSFNVAADARSTYKFSFTIIKQINNAIKLLSQLAFECGCWLFWNYANRLEILAYATAPNFSVSGGATPISDDIFIHQPEIHAIDFDNTGDAEITFSGTADHRITGDLTVEMWLYFTNFDDNQTIISCDAIGENEADNCLYKIYFTAADTVVCFHEYDAGDDETVTITLDASLSIATWYHITIRRETPYYFVDVYNIKGTIIASGDNAYSNDPTGGGNSFLTIGNNADSDKPMNGKIKEVRLWNDMRTNTEITDNLWKILIGNEANLVGYWRLDEGALTVVDDITANNHNGTVNLTGCTWSTGTTYPDLGYYAQHMIIKGSFGIRPIGTKELVNDLTLNYYKNYQSNNYQKTSNTSIGASEAKYGALVETKNVDFIRDTTTTDALRDDLLTRKKEKYYIATFKTSPSAVNKLEGDIINIRHPLFDVGIMTNGQMKALKWQIISINPLLSSCEIEIKAIALTMP